MDEMKIAIPLQLGGLLITGIIFTETRWLAFPRGGTERRKAERFTRSKRGGMPCHSLRRGQRS